MKILIGSCNPVKIGATRVAFERYFGDVTVEGLDVPSGVPAQPVGDDTFAGAENRARALLALNRAQGMGAAYVVGIEGGIAQAHGRWYGFGAACVADAAGRLGFGISPQFELPRDITDELLAGAELGDVIDRLTGQANTRQGQGAVGYFTRGRVDRQTLVLQGVIMALIPFLNPELYF